jgi:uncharacterized protein YgiM (DUF1202 family)
VSGRRLTTGLIAAALLGGPAVAGADWVKDELRINLRRGSGIQYKIHGVLKSGDEVTIRERTEEWEHVTTNGGKDGWIPAGYTTPVRPPSVKLPDVEAKLAQARAEIDKLQSQISTQSIEVEELASLRAQVEELTTANAELAGSSRWKMLATGGGIVLIGMLVGVLVPRGGGAQRTRRIKL